MKSNVLIKYLIVIHHLIQIHQFQIIIVNAYSVKSLNCIMIIINIIIVESVSSTGGLLPIIRLVYLTHNILCILRD